MKSAAWYAIAVRRKSGRSDPRFLNFIVVTKVKNPKIRGGRYAFGPYLTKKKACEVGSYQGHGLPPKGCP